jgi:hypothetical protein
MGTVFGVFGPLLIYSIGFNTFDEAAPREVPDFWNFRSSLSLPSRANRTCDVKSGQTITSGKEELASSSQNVVGRTLKTTTSSFFPADGVRRGAPIRLHLWNMEAEFCAYLRKS